MKNLFFDIVLCCDKEYGIGKNGTIPWKIKQDMSFFRKMTLSNDTFFKNVVIMGRKTADSLDKPLDERINIVITSQEKYKDGFIACKTLNDAFEYLKTITHNKVFVIGGSVLFDEAINHHLCKNIYLNIIDQDYDCDIKISNDFTKKYILTDYSSEICFCKNQQKDIVLTYRCYGYQNVQEKKYHNMLKNIIDCGDKRATRNAVTYSSFGERLVFDLDNGFPLLTSKKMFFRGIFEELMFFLNGQTNTQILEDIKVNIWKGNTSEEFLKQNNKTHLVKYDMGPMYGFQWRHFGADYKDCYTEYNNQGVDQLKNVIDLLINDPYSRRIIMTTYNPSQAEEGVLYPCHGLTVQFYVEKNNKISLQMYQRSADSFLGVPFNIASYALLLHIIVNLVNNKGQKNYVVGRLIMIFGDTHIYEQHIEHVEEQIKRSTYKFPTLIINKQLNDITDLETLQFSDIFINNYISHDSIKAAMIA